MKTIVFCADGTWNGPGEATDDPKDACATNVFKLYLALSGKDVVDAATYRSANEQERTLADASGAPAQVAKYLHGVGDSDNFLFKLLGGVLGAGVITRIVRGYTFVSRHFEAGDRVVLVGFSRGAYTARALAGLIAGQGLLDARKHDLNDKTKAYRLGSAAWTDYRSRSCRNAPDPTWLQKLVTLTGDLPAFFTRPPEAPQYVVTTIDSVAVWDTVGSLGIPQYQADVNRLDQFRFCDTQLSKQVQAGFHAVSLDEQRADFTPTLWDADPGRVTQMLFAGAHADVGGGYPLAREESGLSDIALQWMVEQLKARGVAFGDLGGSFAPLATGVAHEPWRHSPWSVLKPDPAPRSVLKRSGIAEHPSVQARRSAASVLSDPDALPAAYRPRALA